MATVANEEGEAHQQPSSTARHVSRACRGIELHHKHRIDEPALEFDRAIATYALKTYGPPRKCEVQWSEADGTWYYDIRIDLQGASLSIMFLYEDHIAELVASAPLSEKTARELLVREQAPERPDWSAPDKNVKMDRHGISWKSYSTETTENFSWALGYRGTSLVGVRSEFGS